MTRTDVSAAIPGVGGWSRRREGGRKVAYLNRVLFLVVLVLVFFSLSPSASSFAAETAPDAVPLMDFARELPGASTGTVLERSDEHASAGKAIKATFPSAGGYFDCWTPGVRDWTGYEFLSVDVYNTAKNMLKIGVLVRDSAGNGSYGDRYNGDFQLSPGMNAIKIPLTSMITSGNRPLDLRQVKNWERIVGDKNCILYFSNLRLAGKVIPGLRILPLVDCDSGRTPNDGALKVFLSDQHVHPAVRLGLKCIVGTGWIGGYGTEGVASKRWAAFDFFRFHAYYAGSKPLNVSLQLHDGKGGQAIVPLTLEPGREIDAEVPLTGLSGLRDRDAIDQWNLRFDSADGQPLYLSYLRLVKGDESKKTYPARTLSAEDAALAAFRDQAAAALDELNRRIRQARAAGADTSYYEILPVVAEVALDYRWFVPSCSDERAGYARYIIEQCRQAIAELDQAAAGKRQLLKVPPPPEISRIKAAGSHFQQDGQARLLLNAQDGVPGGNPLFGGPSFYLATSSGSGGSRWDVRDCPIWDVYQKNPETHRVGWDGWCGHYICDASSMGGQGESVVICIESQLTRQAIADFIRQKTVPLLLKNRDMPIHGINWEAAYCCYCDTTAQMFRKFVAQRHGNIVTLNKIWGTNYASFDAVPLPHHTKMAENRAAWFDFADFNCHRFADHYARVAAQLREADPRPDRLLVGGGPGYAFHGTIGLCGVDVEMMHSSLDKGAILNESGGQFYVTDLLRSIARPDEMVIDLEFHGSRPPLILGHLLHGDGAISWCEWLTTSSGYSGLRAIPFNRDYPLNQIAMLLRQNLDARRLEREIVAFDKAPREVALLYSRTSLLQVPPEFLMAERSPYTAELINSYQGAQGAGAAVRFLTEKQLLERQIGQTKILLVSGVTYQTPEVTYAVLKFVEDGGTVVVTPNSWLFDQYNRPADYLNRLGITVAAMRNPKADKRVVVDLKREGGFLQGEVEEVRFSDVPRTQIHAEAGAFGAQALELKGAGTVQELRLSAPAKAMATFADGMAAIAVVQRGKGKLYYLASPLEPSSMTALLDRLYLETGVLRPLVARCKDGSLPSDFECRSVIEGDRLLFYVMNLGNQAATVEVSGPTSPLSIRNLTLDADSPAVLTVPAKDLWIMETKTSNR